MEFISITNDPELAKYFEYCGINDIMVDLEIIGKKERQKGLNTVISGHVLDDVNTIKSVLSCSKCLVRINPIYADSKIEINEVINRGADIIMLPMFKTVEEVENFIDTVGTRAQKYLLLETPQALARMDDILSVDGIDAVHIGLNDLSLGMGLDFLYELLIDGIVEYLAIKIKKRKIKFGFGGVSRLEKGKLILSEHYRLGSEMVIINRNFRYYKDNLTEIATQMDFKNELMKIKEYLKDLETCTVEELEKNKLALKLEISDYIKGLHQ